MKSTLLTLLFSLGQTPPVGVMPAALSAPEALQATIDRGGPLVYVPAGEYLVTEPIRLRSNLRLVFERGVFLRAAEGAFKGKEDALIRIHVANNVQLEGNGLTIVMRKADYMTHPDYTFIDDRGRRRSNSEWRHGIDVRGSTGVTISDAIIHETGGDGVCVGPTWQHGDNPVTDRLASTKVVLRNIYVQGAFRNGFSLTSTEAVAYDCMAVASNGASPQSGWDMEPANPRDLIDVLPENHKKLKKLASEYKAAVSERQAALKEEVDLKTKLLEEVKKANLQAVDGKISVRIDDLQITVTPRDELVRVKEVGDDSDDEGDDSE